MLLHNEIHDRTPRQPQCCIITSSSTTTTTLLTIYICLPPEDDPLELFARNPQHCWGVSTATARMPPAQLELQQIRLAIDLIHVDVEQQKGLVDAARVLERGANAVVKVPPSSPSSVLSLALLAKLPLDEHRSDALQFGLASALIAANGLSNTRLDAGSSVLLALLAKHLLTRVVVLQASHGYCRDLANAHVHDLCESLALVFEPLVVNVEHRQLVWVAANSAFWWKAGEHELKAARRVLKVQLLTDRSQQLIATQLVKSSTVLLEASFTVTPNQSPTLLLNTHLVVQTRLVVAPEHEQVSLWQVQ